jgi:hypothetical protein
MAELLDTIKPDTDYLDSILRDPENEIDDSFQDTHIENLKSILKADPRRYRTFGPYWPSIKTLLLSHGADFLPDDQIDYDVKSVYDYDNPAHTILAACLYSIERVDQGLVYESHHQLLVNPDNIDSDDDYQFVSYDRGMEIRVMQLGL